MRFVGFLTTRGAPNSPQVIVTCSSTPFVVLELHTSQGIQIRRKGEVLDTKLEMRRVTIDQRERDWEMMEKFIRSHAQPGDFIECFYRDAFLDDAPTHYDTIMVCLED